jgi:predicted nicotinamide N-methyase
VTLPAPDHAVFIRAHAVVARPPLVPEVSLYQATEITPVWRAAEEWLVRVGLDPPFWAFAWAGGQALARYLLDRPEVVSGRAVLDFAAGSGLVAIAAAMAGARCVEAVDVDACAGAAMALNAELNGVRITPRIADLVGGADPGWDVVLAGDVCYERPMAERVLPWLRSLAAGGALVLLGDPGRTYLPKRGLTQLARYAVETTREIEDTDVRDTRVWRVEPEE